MRNHSTTVSWFRDEGQSDAKDWACRHRYLRFFFCCACILPILALGCSKAPSQTSDPVATPLENALSYLTIPTYDGSGQVTEPDIAFFDSPRHGFRYWLVFSPYTNGDESKENPSIVGSNDGETWQVPSGVVNPLALPGPVGYLADASIFYDRNSDQLWVYYLDTRPSLGSLGLRRLISSDGVHWQDQGKLFEVKTDRRLALEAEQT